MFHVNPLPAEDSYETQVLFSLKKKKKKTMKKYSRLSSAAVMFGALRVNNPKLLYKLVLEFDNL